MTHDPFAGYDAWKTASPYDEATGDSDEPSKLDAYGHLTWTLGDNDWMACFDAVRVGDEIHYHVVVNCESGGFIETTESGAIPVKDAEKLFGLPSSYVDIGIENHLVARQKREPVGRFAYRDCEKRWKRHIKQLIAEKPSDPDPDGEEAAAAEEQSLDYFNRYIAGDR